MHVSILKPQAAQAQSQAMDVPKVQESIAQAALCGNRVYLYVYIYMYMCVYIFVYVCIHIHIQTYVRMYLYVYIFKCRHK